MRIYWYGTGALHNKIIGPYGNSYMRFPLMEELKQRGHDIIWVGFNYEERRHTPLLDILGIKESNVIQMKAIQELPYEDVEKDLVYQDTDSRTIFKNCGFVDDRNKAALFIELRPWAQSKAGYNFEKESKAQEELIKYFIKINRPIFVHDQDLWYKEIPKEYRKHIHLLCSYTQLPNNKKEGFKSIDFFLTGWDPNYHISWPKYSTNLGSYRKINETFGLDSSHEGYLEIEKEYDTAYCGNVYNRRDEFLKFMKPLHDANQTIIVAGNWLRKKYDDRDFSLDNFPNAIFLGSTEHWSTLPLLSKAKYAVHFANPDQQKNGLIGVRVFEAFMAGTLLFVNRNIKGIEDFVHESQLVSDGDEVLEKLKVLDLAKVYGLWAEKIEKHNIFEYTNKLDAMLSQYNPKQEYAPMVI